tara:strand:+ start:449 stop:598 length:150 start_codon:yes stop_codon:yes gene_type:complete
VQKAKKTKVKIVRKLATEKLPIQRGFLIAATTFARIVRENVDEKPRYTP